MKVNIIAGAKSLRRLSLFFSLAILAGWAPAIASNAEAAPPPSPAVAQPTVTPAMTAAWWQWAFSIPASVHPLRLDPDTLPNQADPSSDFCMVGQHGPTWFVGGIFKVVDIVSAVSVGAETTGTPDVTRTCTIPLGTSVLLPVLNGACDTAGEVALGNLDPAAPLPQKLTYLRTWAKGLGDLIKVARATLRAPGGSVETLTVRRITGGAPFSVTYPPDNVLGLTDPGGGLFPKPNPALAFDDGYWAAFRPTKSGTYVLTSYGSVPDFGFSLRIKYILKVVPPQDQ